MVVQTYSIFTVLAAFVDGVQSGSTSGDGQGSLNLVPLIPYPPLPALIAEWAAIIPLILNLASQREDYITTGEVALQGKLSVGLFPRLGTLAGLSRLLERGTEYLDYASTKGGSSRTVWDVNWGSVFPCANGAAIHAISKHLLNRSNGRVRRMPETLPQNSQQVDFEKSSSQRSSFAASGPTATKPKGDSVSHDQGKNSIRRYQTLHVYRMKRSRKPHSLRHRANKFFDLLPCQALLYLVLAGLTVFLIMFGCYGTAAMIIVSATSKVVAKTTRIRRPPGYLKNSEDHGACMLVAAHENATEWHLYVGDRSVVDTFLNKPMFDIPSGQSSQLAAKWFSSAHLLQLAAMTFVAAQKGWDGVCLVVLLAAHWAASFFYSSQALASDWLEREGIDAEVKSFEYGGRFAMMGSIQLFSQSASTRWMDPILVPHPRREAWLTRLRGEVWEHHLDNNDERWLDIAANTSFAAAEVLRAEFGDNSTTLDAAQV
jgi:hypothetical protein